MVNEQSFLVDHYLMIALGLGTLFNCFWLYHFRNKLKLNLFVIVLLSILHTVLGVMCVKAFAVLEVFGDMSKAGNMSLFGGVFFMPAFYYLGAKLFKRSYRAVFDVFTVCMVFTLMLARSNCLISGCCYGNPIHLFGLDQYQWPTREMEILYYIVFLIVVGRKVYLNQTIGNIYPVYMISYGLFRFVTEWLRHSDGNSPIHIAHIWAINSLVIGLSIYFEMKRSHVLNYD